MVICPLPSMATMGNPTASACVAACSSDLGLTVDISTRDKEWPRHVSYVNLATTTSMVLKAHNRIRVKKAVNVVDYESALACVQEEEDRLMRRRRQLLPSLRRRLRLLQRQIQRLATQRISVLPRLEFAWL